MKLKRIITVVGAGALLLGLGMNLNYAIDDYGIGSNSLNLFVLAQTSSSGGNSTSYEHGHQAFAVVKCTKTITTSTGNSSSVSGDISGNWGPISVGVTGGVSGNNQTSTTITEQWKATKYWCEPVDNYVETCVNFDPCI